jgi:hypothetical protein
VDTHRVYGMYAHTSKVGVQLKDVIVRAMFEIMWKKLRKIIKRIKRPIEV